MLLAINVVMIVFVLAPIVLVVWISFTPTASFVLPLTDFSLRWYREALTYPGFIDGFLLSLQLAAITAIVTVALSFLATYGLVRYRPAAANVLRTIFTAPLLVPSVVFGIGMLQFVNSLGLYNSLTGLVLAHIILVVPFAMRSVEVTLRQVPEDLEWAAMLLGRTRAGTLLRVTLPLSARGLVSATIFCFILSFSEVTTTLFMSGPSLQTLPIRIYNYMSDRIDPTVAAVSSIVIITSLVVVLLLNVLGGLRRLTVH